MNKKTKKELVIIIPLVAIGAYLLIGFGLASLDSQEPIQFSESECQEGWFKYELETGTLCSKTELSDSQLEEYQG